MNIRTFQPGDEIHQAEIYNEAAGSFPGFKPATTPEIRRRTQARDFDPSMRFYACQGEEPVGYCVFTADGRISYPWCRKGHEECAEPLLEHVLKAMRNKRFPVAFAAYRHDWLPVGEFFTGHGFSHVREMLNFVQQITDMPTIPAKPSRLFTPLQRSDVAVLYQFAPKVFRVSSAKQLEAHLFDNPYFPPESLFALRSKTNRQPVAVGLLIADVNYADPEAADPLMPCFRLGAFGSEVKQTKRMRGLFSFLTQDTPEWPQLALDLLGQAAFRLQKFDEINCLCAQAPSDAGPLMHFYRQHFRSQGGFPVWELPLGPR